MEISPVIILFLYLWFIQSQEISPEEKKDFKMKNY